MLASRLLMGGGGGSFSVPPPPAVSDMTMVAYLTRTTNLVINNNTAFPWEAADVLDGAFASWDIGDPTKLVIEADGWYFIGGDFTTLGTNYGGANNTGWLALVGRNGIDLAHTIIGERHYTIATGGAGTSADAMSIGAPRYLFAGDEIEVYFQNVASGVTNMLVESNPSGGPTPPSIPGDYTTESGTGAISPHLYLIALAGAAP